MSQQRHHPAPIQRFFSLWLAALAIFLVLLGWCHSALSPSEAPRSTASAASVAPGPASPAEQSAPPSATPAPPPYDADSAEYLLTVFPLQGMHHVTDAEPVLTLLPPGNVMVAQVLRRDPSPAIMPEGAQVQYSLDAAYAGGPNSAIAEGSLAPAPNGAPYFLAGPIPVLPYPAEGRFEPYPVARAKALDAQGSVLVETGFVLPVSTEIGCRNCHTGPWKTADAGGISAATAGNILNVHDRRNGTQLAEQAADNRTVVCRACHSGAGEQPNLSAALHGFHATMKLEGAEACGLCHPSSEQGRTRFYRGYHAMWQLDCTRCHGPMTDHAISLLRFEAEKGNKAASARLTQLQPALVGEARDIKPREPWANLPQCYGCHDFKAKPDASTASAFNKWTSKEGELYSRLLENTGTLRCPSCHGAPHALYPATGPDGDDRDNIQPLQYQKAALPLGKDGNCKACHTVDLPVEAFVHHDRVQ